MSKAIAKQLRAFLAVVVLVALALATTHYIVQNQRLRIPILEERPFELRAELETAQAVVPGQGQTIRVAGVRVGDVQEVELDEGVGVVSFAIDREFLPIYRDATILMRPQTGLKDMYFQLDPGTRAAGEIPERGTIPLTNTAPDVNLDEILAGLDGDTRAYLRALLVGGGQGLAGRGRDLGGLLRALGPINRELERLNGEVVERHRNVAHLVHVFRELAGAVGRQDDDLAELVDASSETLGAIARHAPDLERTVRLLPGTLRTSRETLGRLGELGAVLGPTANELRPFAGRLDELSDSLRRLAEEGTPVIEGEIRPFVREARGPVRDLRVGAGRYALAAPRLTAATRGLNRALNTAAFNPNGAEAPGTPGRDEGYLYWIAWGAHVGNSSYELQDAHGPIRRGYLTARCSVIAQILASSPLAPAISGVAPLFQAGGPCSS